MWQNKWKILPNRKIKRTTDVLKITLIQKIDNVDKNLTSEINRG